MMMFHREGFVSADASEMWAGYYAHLITEWKDGTSEQRSIPCRTKQEAEEIVEKFLTGQYSAEG